ncbi:MAG: MFS transporter [Akkermansiaceae bacterium]|nr:MFS transporter [Akkermansiaceae bacterium]MCP5549815.1 MFS transporter [Akkermansiaceae bacterium]
MANYRTAPAVTDRMPSGIPYIIGNDAAERFSFYGMKAILLVFMTKYLKGVNGEPAPMSAGAADFWIHFFVGVAFLTPLLGAIVSDVWLGKYRTIIVLSIVYCLGHLTLALDETRFGLALGLGLIALGVGGIKPCVSAHVGDQFGNRNGHLVSRAFGWFYVAINLGAFASSLATPLILKKVGPGWAFGVPGILMLIATVIFWMGRNHFVHIPPVGKERFIAEVLTRENRVFFRRMAVIYFIFIAMFWALFDQNASTWVEQAMKMDTRVFGHEFLPSQFQALNPFFILVMVPLFNFTLYPALNRLFRLTDLRKIAIGLFLAVPSFLIPAWIESRIAAGETPTIWWQVLAYAFQTASEVMVSVTALEFAYTQAGPRMKSLVMTFFLLSVWVGNWFAALVILLVKGEDSPLNLSSTGFFLFFAVTMFVLAVLFLPVTRHFRPRFILQADEEESGAATGVSPEEAEAEMH